MKRLAILAIFAMALAPMASYADAYVPNNSVSGNYVEVRSCDIYTGPCFANGEMGLTGKEAVMAWSVDSGAWHGVDLSGLNVIAVVITNDTIGDVTRESHDSKSMLIVDAKADEAQRLALADMARTKAADIIGDVVLTKAAAIESSFGGGHGGTAKVHAEGLVALESRALCHDDHICSNEVVYYPPMSDVDDAMPAVAELAKFDDKSLGTTFEVSGGRNVFLATFKG